MSNESLPAKTELKSANQILQLVSFNLADEEYGVEVLKVREIIRMPVITRMPNVPSYVVGVINLRGKVIPIISLRNKFGLMECENSITTRIMVMDVHNQLIGFIVDSVSEVIRINDSEIQPPPNIALSGAISKEFIYGVFNHGEKLLILIDLDKMIDPEDPVIPT